MIDISLLFGRLALGLYIGLSGWSKVMGSGGVAGFVNEAMLARPSWFPESIARPYGYVMPFLEIASGLAMVLGLFTRIAAGIATILLASFAVAIISALGPAGGTSGPFHFTVVLATLAFLLSIIGSGRLALDPLYFGGGGPK